LTAAQATNGVAAWRQMATTTLAAANRLLGTNQANLRERSSDTRVFSRLSCQALIKWVFPRNEGGFFMQAKGKVSRNDPCPCGSGIKYKKCCLITAALVDPTPPNNEELNGVIPSVVVRGTRRLTLSSYVWKNHRWRVIWNGMHYRPLTETFHDFLLLLLRWTYGKEWLDHQRTLPLEQQHAVFRWLGSFNDLARSPLRIAKGAYVPSGPMRAALSLAYDLYFLQLINKLPDSLIERLRDMKSFQGARYEIAVAATFARADFDIELLDEKVKKEKHCEFIAKHKRTGAEVYVEAKSRVRRGVLNQPGTFDETKGVKGDVRGLYQSALTQAPPDKPFLIFIDANLPTDDLPTPDRPAVYGIPFDKIPWMVEIETMLKDDWGIEGKGKTPETAVVITNFAPHFGEEDAVAPQGFFGIIPSPNPQNPLLDPYVADDLFYCLLHYGSVPKEI
jgi:SEC-C motif-containing protein